MGQPSCWVGYPCKIKLLKKELMFNPYRGRRVTVGLASPQPYTLFSLWLAATRFKHSARKTGFYFCCCFPSDRATNQNHCQSRSQSLRSPWPAVEKRELWEQPFWNKKGNNRILPIRFHCAVCIYGACLKWLLPELSFSERWLRGTKTLGTRLNHCRKL